MKKKLLLCLALVLVAILSLSVFVACNEEGTPDNNGDQTGGDTTGGDTTGGDNTGDQTGSDKVTVSWYNGTTLLKEEQVDKGTVLTTWTPEVEGKTFMGWYSEISLTIAWDFATAVNEDVDIFAGFRTDSFTEDTTEWYLIGSGAGTLKDSNWNESDPDAMKLARVDEANVNKFTITATLYEGDAFQIRAKGTWTGQHGVGYLDGYTTLEEADGDVVGEVVVNEERYFYANKGFGDVATGWDVKVAKSGIYVLTLQTFPGSSAYDKIYFERTGDAPVIEETHKMAIIGTMNGWSTEYADDSEWLMIADDATKQAFTLSFFVTEDMYGIKYDSETGEPIQKVEEGEPVVDDEGNPVYERYDYAELKVYNIVNSKYYGGEADANFQVTKGKYTVKFNVAEDKATVTRESEGFFLAGVLDGGDSWIATAAHPLTKVSDTEYVAYYTFTSADCASWIAEAGAKGAVKVVYGFSGGSEDLIWYGADAEGNNVMVPESGLYMIKLTLNDAEDFTAGGIVTAIKLEGFYLVGTIVDGDTWAPEVGNELTDGSITYTFEDKDTASWLGEGEFAAIKIIEVLAEANVADDGTESFIVWYGGGEDGQANVIIPTAGTYTITITEGVITVTAAE